VVIPRLRVASKRSTEQQVIAGRRSFGYDGVMWAPTSQRHGERIVPIVIGLGAHHSGTNARTPLPATHVATVQFCVPVAASLSVDRRTRYQGDCDGQVVPRP
jgi:hypothetical protein